MSKFNDSTSDQVAEYYASQRLQDEAAQAEQKRIINVLLDLKVIRRCGATDKLVAFDTNGEKVVYLTGLEK
jgi:hypothetical protein